MGVRSGFTRSAVSLSISVALFVSCAGPPRDETDHIPPEAQLRLDISDAIRHAHRLELEFWENPDRFADRNAVFDHYRKGFSAELARNLTDYTWPQGEPSPRPGDATLSPPERVHFVEIGETQAVAYFESAEEMRETWDQERYVVVSLARENGQWVIVHSDTLPEPPAGGE